ncbi:MAG TPA: VTT domain-containing protein [Prolixibacteraceae bacterium]|nr:VTT domain-containing protein [Prolixibacteraceae bacterium]
MPQRRINIKRLVIVVLLIVIATAIASLTVGRDIYYGFTGHGMLSFAIVSLAGYLFFFFIPVEIAFIFYLTSGENFLLLNAVALGTALLSQSVDYLIGYSISSKIIDQLIGRRRYMKAEQEIRKYGNISIFVFNFLPLSSPVISLAAGMLKHRIKDALIYTILGLALKYAILTLIFFK